MLVTIGVSSLSGCLDPVPFGSKADTDVELYRIAIQNRGSSEYTAHIKIFESDEVVFGETHTIGPESFPWWEPSIDQKGEFRFEIAIEELSTTRTLDSTDHVSDSDECLDLILRINENGWTRFDVKSYTDC
ncbi:hypothetical protein [Halomontanus rarus]|uniref:hypothetical protein n=1 Tax=Halomontanus rarus TaxID=3034020 RepID=UPI00293BDD64|nr:hypothetical protein [Halovivax sp. KZCA124]